MTTTQEIGQKLVGLCRQGKYFEAIEQLYAPDIVSMEAASNPVFDQTLRGIDAIKKKNKWWLDNHEIHSGETIGPFPHGNQFCVYFKLEVTNKPSGQRFKMDEVAVYTVEDGKIKKEQFFYTVG